jgi:hypothetical protein
MSDITMCSGVGCELKEKCHRFISSSEYRQSYFTKPPVAEDGVVLCFGDANSILDQLNSIVNTKRK